MHSHKLPVVLLASLASIVACSDDQNAGVSAATTIIASTETGDSMPTGAETDSDSMTTSGDGDGDTMTGDGDGDTTSGDGDGDPATTTGDGDGDPTTTGDGDGDPTTTGDGDGDGDGDPTGDGDGDPPPPECIDNDQDGYGENCDLGPDCDDDDAYNHTVDGCANCADNDMDGHWVGCDSYDDQQPGEDCDDNNFNAFTPDGCANCVDDDNDDFWVGCDQYGDDMPGPDCADNNPNVGIDDAQEICDGLSQNCAGEIDNAPIDDMCPPGGIPVPNVMAWACNPPGPGQDGCEILTCDDQYWDLDANAGNGCECEGTSRLQSLASCGPDQAGNLGNLTEDDELLNIPVGTIPELDNGIGGGAEDWYWFTAPENGGGGDRPNSGSIQVDFALNQGGDYRFEVYRGCNLPPQSGGLATAYGVGAPPLTEWWFFDNHVASPLNNVAWPTTTYIRVFRIQNANTCNDYQLSVIRVAN